jgi:hypothetical protein
MTYNDFTAYLDFLQQSPFNCFILAILIAMNLPMKSFALSGDINTSGVIGLEETIYVMRCISGACFSGQAKLAVRRHRYWNYHNSTKQLSSQKTPLTYLT